jgi:hypothetical protein
MVAQGMKLYLEAVKQGIEATPDAELARTFMTEVIDKAKLVSELMSEPGTTLTNEAITEALAKALKSELQEAGVPEDAVDDLVAIGADILTQRLVEAGEVVGGGAEARGEAVLSPPRPDPGEPGSPAPGSGLDGPGGAGTLTATGAFEPAGQRPGIRTDSHVVTNSISLAIDLDTGHVTGEATVIDRFLQPPSCADQPVPGQAMVNQEWIWKITLEGTYSGQSARLEGTGRVSFSMVEPCGPPGSWDVTWRARLEAISITGELVEDCLAKQLPVLCMSTVATGLARPGVAVFPFELTAK